LAVERFHVRSTGIAPLRLEFVGTLWLILSKWGLYFSGKHNFLMNISSYPYTQYCASFLSTMFEGAMVLVKKGNWTPL
jgi:hypothetical protein